MEPKKAERKYRRVTFVEKNFTNRPVRALLKAGLAPKTFALLETTGRKSGQKRYTPVGNGLKDDTFWLVAEHGFRADYVKNIQADPQVRVRIGRRWFDGVAHVLPDDDPIARSRAMPHKADAALARILGTNPVSVRIDLRQG